MQLHLPEWAREHQKIFLKIQYSSYYLLAQAYFPTEPQVSEQQT